MMGTSMAKALNFLRTATPTRVLMSETSSKDKASIHGKMPLSIREPLFRDLSMGLDSSFLPMAKPFKNTMTTIRKSTLKMIKKPSRAVEFLPTVKTNSNKKLSFSKNPDTSGTPVQYQAKAFHPTNQSLTKNQAN